MACGNSFEDLWEDEDLADVVFYVGNNSTTGVWRISAHKLVLSSFSRVFKEMFFENSLNSDDEDSSSEVSRIKINNEPVEDDLMEVPIKDVPPDIFDHFLRYLYTNKLEIYTISSALLLHYVGVKYEVNFVRDTAFEYLLSNVDSKNVFSVVNWLRESGRGEESIFTDRFTYNSRIALKSNAFALLNLEEIKRIFSKINGKFPFLSFLMDALFHWSITECKRRHFVLNSKNKSSILEIILDKIPFSSKSAGIILENYMKKETVNQNDKESFHSQFQPKPSFSVCRFTGSFYFQKEEEVEGENFYRQHCLGFISDTPLLLIGLSLSGNPEITDESGDSKIMLIKHFEVLIEIPIKNPNVQNNQMFINFPDPISIIPHIFYKIYLYLTFPCYNIVGADALNPEYKWTFEDKEGTIIFFNCSLADEEANYSSVDSGQLYKLFFKLP